MELSPNTRRELAIVATIQNKSKTDDARRQRIRRERKVMQKATSTLNTPFIFNEVLINPTQEVEGNPLRADNIFKEYAQKIKIYLAQEIINDPFEKSVDLTYMNSLPINAIVTDLDPTSAMWKMPGIIINKAKQLIIEKKRKYIINLKK